MLSEDVDVDEVVYFDSEAELDEDDEEYFQG